MATRRIWYTLSAVLMIASMALFFVTGLNLHGGVHRRHQGRGHLPGTADVEKVRTALEEQGFHEPTVQAFGTARDISARLAPDRAARHRRAGAQSRVDAALRSVDPGVDIKPLEFVGPQVGDELRNSAILAPVHHPAAGVRLPRFPLPHLAPVDGRHPGAAARSHPHHRLVRAVADALRPRGGGGAAGRGGLLAERHHHRVRPHPRALRGQPPARAAGWCWTSPSTRRCRAPS